MKQEKNQSHHKIVYLVIILGLLFLISILALICIYLYQAKETTTNLLFLFYKKSDMLKTYKEGHDQFLKKGLFIFKKYNCKFTNEEQIDILSLAYELSEETRISPMLFLAQAYEESGFNQKAVGMHGERSFLQFMPSTWRRLSGHDNFLYIDDKLLVTRMYFKLMRDNQRIIEADNPVDVKQELLLAYNCGIDYVLRNVNDSKDFNIIKNWTYKSKNLKYYPDKIIERFNEFNNLKVE